MQRPCATLDIFMTEDIFNTSIAFWRSAALFCVLKLNLFEILMKGAMTANQIAEICSTDEGATARILRAMLAMGWVEKVEGGYRCPQPVIERTIPGGSKDLSPFCRLMGEDFSSGMWAGLPDTVRRDATHPMPIIDEKPASPELFTMAMHSLSLQGEASALCQSFNLNGARRLADFGGGSGAYSIALCRFHSDLCAVVVEKPEVAEITRKVIADNGLSGRIEVVPSDWNDVDFKGVFDAALLSDVLYSSEGECRNLVRIARQSLKRDGRLAVRGYFLDDDDSRTFPALFDINLLVHSPAQRTYDAAEVKNWLWEQGFADVYAAPLTEISYLLTARKK